MIKRLNWLDVLPGRQVSNTSLDPLVRQALSRLDETLFDAWGLGNNLILAWTRESVVLRFLVVRHYAIIDGFSPGKKAASQKTSRSQEFINEILAGPKFLPQGEFSALCVVLGKTAQVIAVQVQDGAESYTELISSLVTRYSVSLLRERAVVLLDAVGFSLHSPLEQMAMVNSLSYSVNSAYRQLLSNDIDINFARTTTGDGFYIWNRARTVDANIALYKLMMLILADNAVAQRKAKQSPVPKLRAAFHVGEHYEFYQVEGLNPTTQGYIVGQVTIDLARILERALPGQILLGDFELAAVRSQVNGGTIGFVEQTAGTLDQLNGLAIAGDNVKAIRCYLTGERAVGGDFLVSRYAIRDKHGKTHFVFNAKINIHPRKTKPLLLGIQHQDIHPPGGQSPLWP